jgi:hypothetical protein
MVEGQRHFAGALELLSELPDDIKRDRRELELLLALGPTLIAVKGWATPETERAYTRARVLCDRLGDSPELFPALFGMWAIHLDRGDFRNASKLTGELVTAEGAHDPVSTRIRTAGSRSNLVLDGQLPSRQRVSRKRDHTF